MVRFKVAVLTAGMTLRGTDETTQVRQRRNGTRPRPERASRRSCGGGRALNGYCENVKGFIQQDMPSEVGMATVQTFSVDHECRRWYP